GSRSPGRRWPVPARRRKRRQRPPREGGASAGHHHAASADRITEEQHDDDNRGDAGGEGDEGRQEPQIRARHPFALSTTRTLKGAELPCCVTSNESPQWPTMTSSGAAWP